MRNNIKITIFTLSILFFAINVSEEAYAQNISNWDLTIFSSKNFDFDDLQFNLKITSNLKEHRFVQCNNSVEISKIQNFIVDARNFGIEINPVRPLNEFGCSFYGKTKNNTIVFIDNDIIVVKVPISGFYDKIPPHSWELEYANRIIQIFGTSSQKITILHLDIPEKTSLNDINKISKNLESSNYSPFLLDVGVPELFAVSKYYPFAEESRLYPPLILVNRGHPIDGSYSNTWSYPILFLRISTVNSIMIGKLQDIDTMLKFELQNITKAESEAFSIFQNSRKGKNYLDGIDSLISLRGKLKEIEISSLDEIKLDQIKILLSLEEKELRTIDPNQNEFLKYYEPMLSSQVNDVEQLLESVENRIESFNLMKGKSETSMKELENDLFIFQQIETDKIMMYLSIIPIVLTIFVGEMFGPIIGRKISNWIKYKWRKINRIR